MFSQCDFSISRVFAENKKIFKRSKGSLKLLNIGEPIKTTNLEISYASKKAVEVLEKLGGKIKLTKK